MDVWIVLIWAAVGALILCGASVALGFLFAGIILRRERQVPVDFVRRPILPERDGQRVTRDPEAPKGHARVSTAHVSQPRRNWR